jgi:hypothetical protein
MWIKREWLQLGGSFFWNFSRHPLLIWLHCFFHHYKTLKAVATVTATAGIVVLTPANFYHFRRPKFNFQPLSVTFETFGKKLTEIKIVAWVNGKKSEQKNRNEWSGNDFLPKLVNNGKSRRFFDRCWGFAEMLWVKISS